MEVADGFRASDSMIKIEKKQVAELEKCYALAEISRDGKTEYLVASEKQHPCIELGETGELLGNVWDGPGGVMTLEPLTGQNGAFLATHRFYSPNDSAEASIVLAEPGESGWSVQTICRLPFVHRFGVLERDGRSYIAAATLKSAHAFRNDWTCPGRVWVGELPETLDGLHGERELPLTALISGLTRNHGFFKHRENGYTCAYVSADNGVYRVEPPSAGGEWKYEQVLDVPTSDIALADFDGDGEDELLTLSPFHGNRATVYKRTDKGYTPVYFFECPLPFLHAIGVCQVAGRSVAVIGNREGDREIILLYWQNGRYVKQVIDRDVGPANVLCREKKGGLFILAANREINQVTMYQITLDT